MKDNKDEEKTLFQAIDAVDDKFLMETLKDMEKRKNQNHKQQLKFKQMTPMVKAATIALICFLTLGISVSVAAATSKTFRQWIQKTFMSQTIYKVTQTKDVSDHKKNQKIVLKDNMEIKQGHNQSFICQYHYEGKYDVEVTDKVYTIEGNHLKELKPEKKWFHGIYNGRKFSFQYAVIRGEIYVYNVKGNISDIFWKVWDEDTIYVTDVGQHQMWAAQYLKHNKAKKFITSGGLGTMGFGYGAAIGAQMGCPKDRVIHITGDGSFHMNLNEACTAVSENLPVITVIMNNRVLGMVYQWQTIFYENRYSNTTPERKTDFVKLAEAFGAKGYRAETVEQFEAAMEKALQSDGPVWIDCLISREERVLPMIPGGKTVEDMIID